VPALPGFPTRFALDGALAVCGLNLSKESDEALMLVRVRRQSGYVLGESIAALAPVECLRSDVLTILLGSKEPAKERLADPRRKPAKLDMEHGIRIRAEMMHHRFESRANSELLQDAPEVGTDRVRASPELCCDRPGVRALGRETEHHGLLRRELLMSWLVIHRPKPH
jgi:hypothetical protein